MTTLFKDDWLRRGVLHKPLRCQGPKDRASGPFGNEGRRRCPNTATRFVVPITASQVRLGTLALCLDHTPEGQFGLNTPTNWTWDWKR